MITKCKHTFCKDCLDKLMESYDDDDEDVINDRRPDPENISKPCPTCHKKFKRCDTYLRIAFMPEQPADSNDFQQTIRAELEQFNLGIDDNDEELPDLFTLMSKTEVKRNLLPSVKIRTYHNLSHPTFTPLSAPQLVKRLHS